MIHEYRYEVTDTTHDKKGNPLMEIHLFIKPNNADRWDITEKLSEFLEGLLKEEANV
jgi:hypothetical protein